MTEVFENDFSESYGDVNGLTDATAERFTYTAPAEYLAESFSAEVTPVVSPDNSYNTMRTLMSEVGSGDILYIEQLDSNDYMSDLTADTPFKWMDEAADRGADVRYLLDDSYSTSADDHRDYVDILNSQTKVKAKNINHKSVTSPDFSVVHNKGLIFSHSVWVGSVNWTDSSFQQNREVAVLIHSDEAVSFYKSHFDNDFGEVTDDLGRDDGKTYYQIIKSNDNHGSIDIDVSSAAPGDTVTFEVKADPGYETSEVTVNNEVITPSDGKYTFEMPSDTVNIGVTFDKVGGSEGGETIPGLDTEGNLLYYIIAAVLVLLGTVSAAVKKGGRKRRRSQKVNTFRRRGTRISRRRRRIRILRDSSVRTRHTYRGRPR